VSTPRIIVQAQEFATRVVARGLRGERGQGVIPGGAQGQILGKRSGADYDTEWLNPGDAPSLVNTVTATAPITSTGGVDPVIGITPATPSAPGSMSAADKAKLDLILQSSAPPAVAASSQAGASARAAREDHTHAHGSQPGGTLHSVATGGVGGSAGFMSVNDKNKLDGIQAGAQVNVATNLGIGGTGNARTVTSSTGTAATLPIATQAAAGVMSVEDKAKLDGIAPGATVYTDTIARGQVEAMLIAGANVTLTYSGSGASRTVTISASGGGGGGSGTVTSVQASGGTTGLTFSGGPITIAGTLTLGGTLGIANGGTGATTAEGARAAIGAGTGNGTVTSVGLSLPSIFSVSNSPVTGAGTITATLASQTASRVWASPAGSDGAPTFRELVQGDIPALSASKIVLSDDRLLGQISGGSAATQISLGTGLSFTAAALTLSANLQGWHALAPSSKQNALTAGTGITIVDNVISATATGGSAVRPITVGWDAGTVNGIDQPLTTGRRVELRAVTGLTPVAWTLLPKAGSTGSITVEVRKRPFSSGTFTAITAGSPPSISSGARGTASASAWTAIDDGDLIEMEVTSVTGTVTGITLIIEATEA
jgi:hypothetical protein